MSTCTGLAHLSVRVTLNLFGNYTLGIRKPPYFVIASGAKQSRAVCAHSGLLRSARNDGMTDAKAISANLFQGPWPTLSTSAAPDERAGHGCQNKFGMTKEERDRLFIRAEIQTDPLLTGRDRDQLDARGATAQQAQVAARAA